MSDVQSAVKENSFAGNKKKKHMLSGNISYGSLTTVWTDRRVLYEYDGIMVSQTADGTNQNVKKSF